MKDHSVFFYQNKTGLYNLQINNERNVPVVDVHNVQLDKIIELIRKYFDEDKA